MKKVCFTEEQMVAVLREADKAPGAEVAKTHKISEPVRPHSSLKYLTRFEFKQRHQSVNQGAALR